MKKTLDLFSLCEERDRKGAEGERERREEAEGGSEGGREREIENK